MATGDLKNNLKKLQTAVKTIKYEKDVDVESLSKGIPGSFLPIYHFAFIDYSRFVAEKISELNIELYGKADLRFIEGMYKVLRELFSYKPALTKDQFFSNGFAEKKVIMCTDILNQIRSMHLKLAPKPRPKTAPTNMTSALVTNVTASAINHKTQSLPNTANKVVKSPKPDISKETSNPMIRNAAYSNISQSKQAQIPVVQVQSELKLPTVVNETLTKLPASTDKLPVDIDSVAAGKPITVTKVPNSVQVYPDLGVPQIMVQPYNPSAYASGERKRPDSPVIEIEQQNVEVVSLDSDVDYDANVRPIDMIAKTPGKPLIESHVQRHTTGRDQNLLSVVEQKLTNVAENVSRLVGRLSAVEEKLTLLENRPSQNYVSEPAVENILARLTLLENSFKLIKAQTKPVSQANEQSFTDSLERYSNVNEPLNTAMEVNMRHLVHSFSEGDNTLSSPTMSSTPVEQLQKRKDVSNKENTVPQAERIKSMLKDTESMLNMNTRSPAQIETVPNDMTS